MAQVDSTGVTPHTTEDFVAELAAQFADVYPDIDLAPHTPQGQMIGLWAQGLAQHDQRIVQVFNQLCIDTAAGRWLENICSTLNVLRDAGESDADYRSRYKAAIGSTATGVREAICANVRRLAGVTYCGVAENTGGDSAVVSGLTLSAHSIGVVVEGTAESADVAGVIALHKPLGIDTNGGTTTNVANADGSSSSIAYFPVEHVAADVDITITTEAEFPHDGAVLISNAMVDYFARLLPGELHSDQRARAAILNAAGGFSIASVAYSQTSGSSIPNTLRLDQRLTLAISDVSVVIST